MAIYHVTRRKVGGWSVQLEMHVGGIKRKSPVLYVDSLEGLRLATIDLGKAAKDAREAAKKFSLAQVNRGEEKT